MRRSNIRQVRVSRSPVTDLIGETILAMRKFVKTRDCTPFQALEFAEQHPPAVFVPDAAAERMEASL